MIEPEAFVLGQLDEMRFNIMVAGREGLGKTTFLTSFFALYTEDGTIKMNLSAENESKKTISVQELQSVTLRAANVDVDVHLIDTPGFGLDVDNRKSIAGLKQYLEEKHTRWCRLVHPTMSLQELSSQDERVHCIFYFLPPHRMSGLDYECLLQLAGLAPVVPVVSQTDCMTLERREYVKEVQYTIGKLQTQLGRPVVYDFEGHRDSGTPSCTLSSSVEYFERVPCDYPWVMWLQGCLTRLISILSVALMGEEQTTHTPLDCFETTSHRVSVFSLVCTTDPEGLRRYPFGAVDTYNPEHSDLRHLQSLLLESGVHLLGMMRSTTEMTIQLQKKKMRTEREYWVALTIMVLVCGIVVQILISHAVASVLQAVESCIRHCTISGVDLM